MEQQALLNAIRANPDDRTARLVYADWLDEHDDPLAEYVRVECELAACAFGTPEWHRTIDRLFTVCDRVDKNLGGWEFAEDAERIARRPRGMTFNPPIPETNLIEFEKRHGITLPGEYRAFLLRVGNGGTYFRNRELRRFDHTEMVPELDRLFPYTHADVTRLLSALDKAVPLSCEGCDAKYSRDGGLVVAAAEVLVVRGELRGQVWVYGEYTSFTPWSTDFIRPTGFFEYFETIPAG
jgi:uncharacterized protein (TIGR02996 family)